MEERQGDPEHSYKILVCDLVGLRFGKAGEPDPSEVKAHIEQHDGVFHIGGIKPRKTYAPGLHFFYLPDLSTDAEILPLTKDGQYDAVIAAATHLPAQSRFDLGGVRIGSGTGNMKCASWGGGEGKGGSAPLMNTPSFNSRATAQMAFKALLRVLPDLSVDELHKRTLAGRFDTGKHLKDFPTEKLEGKVIGILGYGNIGREVAKLATAFGMKVKIFARQKHAAWIESEGWIHAATAEAAAEGADVLSTHTGLGTFDPALGRFANAGIVNWSVLSKLSKGAVLLNYDRGECVDTKALDRAMKSNIVRFAAIDADVFVEAKRVSGPMVPYLPLAKTYPGRIELLPHAAADTDHVSRVEGAKQAVDQMIDCIRYKRVTNLKGDLPPGYVNAGSVTRRGVGRVAESTIVAFVTDEKQFAKARDSAAALSLLLADADNLVQQQRDLMHCVNTLVSTLRMAGLEGPIEKAEVASTT